MIEMQVAMADLSALAATVPLRANALSPLERATPPDNAARARLRAALALGEDGTATSGCTAALGVLAAPDAMAAVRIVGGANDYQCAVYRSADASASISSIGGDVRLRMPAQAAILIAAAWERLGVGDALPMDLDLVLPDGEAATFLAVIDALRRARLAQLAGGPEAPSTLERAAIAATTAGPSLSSLAAALHIATARGDVLTALPALVRRGLLAPNGEGFRAAPTLQRLADRFLVLARSIDVRAIRGAQPGATAIEFGALQASVNDLLRWERRSATEVGLAVTTPNRFMYVLAPLLADPTILPAASGPEPAAAPPAAEAPKFCSSCGQPLRERAKFCGACGAAVAGPR